MVDLLSFASVTDPQIHPDGTRVAFVVSRMNFEEDRYDREIWLWDGSSARPFTHGPADSRPRWSPDGERLAFLRSSGKEGDKAQVAVMPSGGGEATVRTSFALGASEAEWSPDGARLAVVGTEWLGDWADLDDEARKRRPRRIGGAGYRFDNQGWRHDRRRNIYLLDPDDGDPVALTTEDFLDSDVVWHPDGAAVAFMSARHERAHFDSGSQAWEVETTGGEAKALVDVGHWGSVSYRPDGVPHLIGMPDLWTYPGVFGLYRIDEAGLMPLAGDLDRSFAPPSPPVTPGGLQWLADGSCRCVIDDRAISRVVEVHPDGTWEDVTGGERMITGMTTRPDGSAMALTVTMATDPGELVWWEDGAEKTATAINEEFRAGAALTEPEHFVVEHDGVDIDAWVFLPPGDDPVPTLLNIHGGPATQYGWGWFDEFHEYVAAGFAVVACNPRGSAGRGTEFVRTPVGRWTEDRPPDLEDVLAVLDAALERFPRLDPDRLGIMGGSYGGFLTTRIIAVDHRFRSAVPERGLYSFTSFAGTSDIGFRFPRHYLGQWGHDDWEELWAASPLSRAHRITTPSLIVHSENDLRCPIEQAEQLFAVLIDNGVEAEMLRFPDSSHELSRSGKPGYRRERFDAIVAWHRRHVDVTT
ncbi:MAG TPA: S9 family peptidase [Acidimicrobiia bacterium]|nr:S9 family peptidase [Acidimicrobiia bacterium]